MSARVSRVYYLGGSGRLLFNGVLTKYSLLSTYFRSEKQLLHPELFLGRFAEPVSDSLPEFLQAVSPFLCFAWFHAHSELGFGPLRTPTEARRT